MNVRPFFALIFISLILNITRGEIIKRYDTEEFYRKTDPKIYKSWLDPEPTKPTDVEVGLKMIHFGPMDEKSSKFTTLLHVYVTWTDPRLAIDPINATQVSHLEIDDTSLARLWKPTIHFANAKPFTPDILNSKLSGQLSGVIDGRGKVFVIKKTQLDAFCKFDIIFYPMDTQSCSIEIESSRYMNLKWNQDPIEIPSNFKWSNFELIGMSTKSGRINYKKAGPYFRLRVTFKLKRYVANYLFNVYLPSTLFVVASWSGFWIDITGQPARVALALTTMLTHVTSTKSYHDQLPKSLFVSSLDIWIIMCTMFIFATIVEYATVNYFFYKPNRVKDKNMPNETRPQLDENGNPIDRNIKINNNKMEYYWYQTWSKIIPPFDEDLQARKFAIRIDHLSRYLFPIMFVIFNIFYWSILAAYID